MLFKRYLEKRDQAKRDPFYLTVMEKPVSSIPNGEEHYKQNYEENERELTCPEKNLTNQRKTSKTVVKKLKSSGIP